MTSPEHVAMPPQDRVRGDDQLELPQPVPWEPAPERGREHPIGGGQLRPVDLTM
jgi:hypothetical protein